MNNALETWSKEVNFPVTICDKDGIIVAMNDRSIGLFSDDGGANQCQCHWKAKNEQYDET